MKLPDKTSFIITLLAIATNIFVSAQIYALLQDSVTHSNLYNGMEAIGSIVMGFLSDKYCRRKTSILTHLMGLILLIYIYFHPQFNFAIILFGFFYNPIPILRAGLVDNFTKFPRLYLLMISCVVQFIPWCFYNQYVKAPSTTMLVYAIGALSVSLVGSFAYFKDKRDKKSPEMKVLTLHKLIHPTGRHKLLYTVAAFFMIQLVFFISDNLQETLVDAPSFYALMSTATTFCLLLALVLKDIAHTAVLRVTYGINAALAFIPLTALYFFKIPHFDTSYQVLMLASFGAMILPFVFDIAMNYISANYRGTACGVIDFAFNAASMFNISLITFLNIHQQDTYLLIAVGLCTAVYFQIKADKKTP